MDSVKIADRFAFHRGERYEEFVGGVFVSTDAIFLHFTSTSSGALLALLTNLFGVPGAGDRFARWAEVRSNVMTPSPLIKLADLSEELTSDPGWPIATRDGYLFVIERPSDVKVSASLFRGVKIVVGGDEFRVAVSCFGYGRKIEGLRRLGWLDQPIDRVERGGDHEPGLS